MRIQDTLVHLLLKQPYYGFLAGSLAPVESDELPRAGLVLLPVPRLLYNREWFEGLSDCEAIGTVIHEILHLVLLHPFRKGNREHMLWTVASDMAVNEFIDPALLPAGSITVDAVSSEIKRSLPRLESAETYYGLLNVLESPLSLLESPDQIKLILKNGRELTASSCTEDDRGEMDGNAVKSIVSDLLRQAGEEGEMPGGLGGHLDRLYKPAEVNWRNVMKRFLTGKGKVQMKKTCKKESRRFEDLPGSKRSTGVGALLALDESGSIGPKQLAAFYNEVLAIKRITGADIWVTQFDTGCTAPVPIGRYARRSERAKGGGTDFRPVFELAAGLGVPLLIIFTDGEGAAPETCSRKVLWALTGKGKRPAAYGHCVTIGG